MNYPVLVAIQAASILFLLFEVIYVFHKWKTRLHSFLYLYILTTLINNLGYLLEMTAKSSEAALIGTQFCYLGKAFIPLAFFSLLVGFCRVKLPKWAYYVVSAVHGVIFLLVLTCRYQKLYYTSIEWVTTGTFPHNVFGHGVFYAVYMYMIMAYFVAGVAILVHFMVLEKNRNRLIAFWLMLVSVMVEMSGFVIFISGASKGYDVTSLAYAVSSVFLCAAIWRFDLLETIAAVGRAERMQKTQQTIITGIATMVESRDNSTGAHIKRTSGTVAVFTEHLLMTEAYPEYDRGFYDMVSRAAPMHDLGKIAVDDAILRKPGRFTPEEFEEMKKHPAEGARVIAEILKDDSEDPDFRRIAVNVAHYHHEKWDGSGYPAGLSGKDIPFEARIMALADVFDALVSKRCYKEEYSYDRAFGIIEESLGTHFDPELGAHFLHIRKELEELYNRL